MPSFSIGPCLPFGRVRIAKQALIPGMESAVISVVPDRRCAPVCSVCEESVRSLHSKSMRWVRDLRFGAREVMLEVTQPRLRCPTCQGIPTERLDFVAPHSRVTNRLAHYIAGLCRMMSVADVARHLGLDWKLVTACDKAVLEEEFGETDVTGLRLLAVDEIAIRKKHHYMTVILDCETGRVVCMGEGRTRI